jgi:signal transduction histidine kinase
MKNKWSDLVRDAAPWLFLLLFCDAFFILLAWLASPEYFPILVGLMVAFSLGSAVLGLGIVARKRQRQEAAFQIFLSEPSMAHETGLIEASDSSLESLIHELGDFLREQQRLLAACDHRAADFEEFIEAWVHEIKTPLSLASLLLVNRRAEMSDEVYKRFEHVRREISEEVDRILYYARSQSDHIDYRFERISLSDCCSEVLEDLKSLFEERDAAVNQNLGDIEVISDMKTLQFIVIQVILNSIKYASAGSRPVIHLDAGEDKDQTRSFLRISDEGIGVPPADLPFIFDKGFTGNHPEHLKATGMGLYLVKKFCDDLNIEIEVDSQVGQGFTILLIFPKVDH